MCIDYNLKMDYFILEILLNSLVLTQYKVFLF